MPSARSIFTVPGADDTTKHITREFECNKCGSITCCEGLEDCNWRLEIARCICGNKILIKRAEFEISKYISAKHKT